MLRSVISRTLGPWNHSEVDGEEILQETLLRALQKLPQLRSHTSASLRGWLSRIARNLCVDKTRHYHAIGRETYEIELHETRAHRRPRFRVQSEIHALDPVSAEERMILCLRVSQDLPWETVRSMTDKHSVRMTRISYGKVLDRLRRGVEFGRFAIEGRPLTREA